MPLTSVSGMHVTGRLKLSDPPSEGTPRRVTQLSQYGGNLTIVLEVQFHGFHAFFTRVHGHPPFWSRILSAHPLGAFRSGLDRLPRVLQRTPAPPGPQLPDADYRPRGHRRRAVGNHIRVICREGEGVT